MSTIHSTDSRLRRAQLRHATWIDPQTATRSKRNFSLGLDFEDDLSEHDPTSPLTSSRRNAANVDRSAWSGTNPVSWRYLEHHIHKSWDFVTSDVGKGMFKCALAYLLGSMATFLPAISAWFGRQDSKHMVATVTVYFHPARSFGSMLEAATVAIVAFMYTAVVSLVSMSISVLFTDVFHLIAVGHAVILVFFIGGGLGYIGWIKLKYGNPLVNIACSLASLSLITILTKEGAVQAGNYSFVKILQILEMIIVGSICSMLVCFLVFPQSGRYMLKQNMAEVADQLSDMLGLIARSFISGDEGELEDPEYVDLNTRYKRASSKISQNLKESKYEHYFFGDERLAALEAKVATCLARIGQSIGGLRSAAAMQFVVAKEVPALTKNIQWQRQMTWDSMCSSSRPDTCARSPHDFGAAFTVGEAMMSSTDGRWRTPAQIFELFIDNLGPSMRSLAYTLKEILDDLPFDADNDYAVSINPQFHDSLQRATDMYREARRDALTLIYNKKDMDRSRSVELEADWEEAAACCGHFSWSLLEVAGEIKRFLSVLEELQTELNEMPSGKSWSWLQFWREPWAAVRDGLGQSERLEGNMHSINLDVAPSRNDPNSWRNSQQAWWKQSLFHRLYEFVGLLRREDYKFGIKVGLGAMLYALPAYIEATQPIYAHYRGEWGLLSYMLVCSMTIGASNTTGYQRFIGTGLGAVLALVAWKMSNDNPAILAFLGFLMAYWTAWIVIGKGKGPMGRFIMLTYNLSALYAYSLTMFNDSDDKDEEDSNNNPLIYSIAGHRVVAVLTGCIWGLIITRAVWPISARQKLKDGLSLIWLRMGLIWKRDPLSVFTDGEDPHSYMNIREENELNQFLSKLSGLVDASKYEFELRRPFPYATYDGILKTTGRMLEAFHAMNVIISKDHELSIGERALLTATAFERKQLSTRLSHQFSVLASSMKLEYAIATDVLPNIDNARDRLLAKIFTYRKEDTEQQKASDEDYGLLYTYALVTGQLGIEVRRCLREVEDLFGILDEESLLLQ